MKLFFGLVACVAALKIAASIGLLVDALGRVSFDAAAEVSCIGTLALMLGSAIHYARRGTVVPPRPLLGACAVLLAAPLVAVALGAEAVAGWEPERFAAESGFVAFQVVGLWIAGGVLFGGPFACPERQEMPEHQVRLRPDSRLLG
ncbi:hypothetical protein [Nannocystis pusilla]|uniref:hypothetical protein n=1 Tax=Nannocystis pusilla TaxID=889268 RepID=UPI003DA2F7EB